MKILILGASGMLGHQLFLHFSARGFDVKGTLHQAESHYQSFGIFDSGNSYFEVDVRRSEVLRQLIERFRPDAVLNAVGVVKQREDAKRVLPSLEINSLLPHRLAELCSPFGTRIVHMSTDCVFS